jgi:hypothetical protein
MYSANHGGTPSRTALHGDGTLIRRLTNLLTLTSINTNVIGNKLDNDKDKDAFKQSGLFISY